MKQTNRLSPHQNHLLFTWLEQHKVEALEHSDPALVRIITTDLGFDVNDNHIQRARAALGLVKKVAVTRPSPHVEYTDEETQVRISALAHATLTLFKILGEDNRPCARRLAELFPELGGVV